MRERERAEGREGESIQYQCRRRRRRRRLFQGEKKNRSKAAILSQRKHELRSVLSSSVTPTLQCTPSSAKNGRRTHRECLCATTFSRRLGRRREEAFVFFLFFDISMLPPFSPFFNVPPFPARPSSRRGLKREVSIAPLRECDATVVVHDGKRAFSKKNKKSGADLNCVE